MLNPTTISMAIIGFALLVYLQHQLNQNNGRKVIITLCALAVLLAVSIGWVKLIYNSPENISNRAEGRAQEKKEKDAETAHNICNNSILAYLTSRGFVERRLKSPSTAEFPSFSVIQSVSLGNCKFQVSAYVDAQNGFGATTRTPYQATLEYIPKEQSWRLLNLKI